MATERREDLLAELRRLGPWHHDIQITADLNTRDWVEDRGPGSADATLGRGMLEDCRSGASLELGRCMFSPARTLEQGLLRYFPEGIGDRSVLDCACNAGGYLFAAKDAGAGRCLGFDVRQHWIDQAEFVRTHREAPSDDMRFAVCNLYELSTLDLEPYDVTLFNGIFYHLPDPVGGLRIAADLTREVMVVNTHTKAGCPDGLMHVGPEGVDHPLSASTGSSSPRPARPRSR